MRSASNSGFRALDILYNPISEQRSLFLKNREQWMELCAQAAVEQNPEKLLILVKEINRLLEEKEKRLIVGKKPPET